MRASSLWWRKWRFMFWFYSLLPHSVEVDELLGVEDGGKNEMYVLSALALLLLPLLQQVSISQETSCTHRFCRLQLKGTVEMLSGGCATPQGLTLLRSYWNFNKTDISKDKPVIFHCQLYYWLKTHQFILLGVQHLFTDFSTVAFYSSCSRTSNQHMPWKPLCKHIWTVGLLHPYHRQTVMPERERANPNQAQPELVNPAGFWFPIFWFSVIPIDFCFKYAFACI